MKKTLPAFLLVGVLLLTACNPFGAVPIVTSEPTPIPTQAPVEAAPENFDGFCRAHARRTDG